MPLKCWYPPTQMIDDAAHPGEYPCRNLGKATKLTEYIDLVMSTRRDWRPRRLWFRGLKNSAYDLKPTAYRHLSYSEAAAFNSFWAVGRGLPGLKELRADDTWDWYFAARHHGLPTRLIDWSSNALVALFFATEATAQPPSSPHDAIVWMLDPDWMNHLFHDDESVMIPYSLDSDDFMRNWLPAKVDSDSPLTDTDGETTNRYPVAIYPSHTNARLIAQQGIFTVHGADDRPLEELIVGLATEPPRCGFITIDRCCVSDVHDELAVLGMTRFSLMADPDSLALQVTNFSTRV